MMLRKGCPRCQGNLFLDKSDGPAVWTCLQCNRSFVAERRAPTAAPAEQDRAA